MLDKIHMINLTEALGAFYEQVMKATCYTSKKDVSGGIMEIKPRDIRTERKIFQKKSAKRFDAAK